ncbi:N-acetylmuramoyl-L-alanine amidase [bacterium]|nr:MAG: N-acetylmuramoyl-L-alanine amidase [bacterium]
MTFLPLLFGVATVFQRQIPEMMPVPWIEPGRGEFYWLMSPNSNDRPKDAVIDTVVVHATVIPTLKATAEAFLRPASQVSAHYTVGRDGSYVMQVRTQDRAWHAGSGFGPGGKPNPNHYSIGIEMVNLNDGKDPWPDVQLETLKWIIAGLKRRYPTIQQIMSHEYLARPTGRKSDPKNFPWGKLADLGLPMYFGEAEGED